MPEEVQNEFEAMVKKNSNSKDTLTKVSSRDSEECRQQAPLRNGMEPYYGANGMNKLEIEVEKHWTVMEKWSSTIATLKRPDVWKPLVILNTYFFFMQFSGVPILIAYAVNIMMSEGVSLEPYFATLLVGVVKLISEFSAGFVQNRYGRRPLSVGSGIGMALCMVGLGLQHHFLAQMKSTLLSWIPLLLIFAYVISAAMGFFLLPWAMLGEVYPTKVAGLACGITTCLGNMFGFAAIKLFPNIVVLLGGSADGNNINCTEEVFYLYGGITCISVIFILIFLPETFRRNIQEISEEFSKSTRKFNLCSKG